MSSGHEERDPGNGPVPAAAPINHIIWGAGLIVDRRRPATTFFNLSTSPGQSSLSKLVALQAEADEAASFKEMAALMEELPGA